MPPKKKGAGLTAKSKRTGLYPMMQAQQVSKTKRKAMEKEEEMFQKLQKSADDNI